MNSVTKKKTISIRIVTLLSLFLICLSFSFSVGADTVNVSGKCGPNLTWKLTGADDYLTLTVSGTGAMTESPWGYYSNAIKKVVLKEGMTNIVDGAFQYCNNLTSIVIPSGVKTIGHGAFNNCSGLMSISLPEGLESIGDSAFYYCSSLKSISIPESVKTIGIEVFSYCGSLKIIILPSRIKYIPTRAFERCTVLYEVVIQGKVTAVGDSAFDNCWKLASINIPRTVEYIGSRSFCNCESLEEINISESVEIIGDYAFWGCKAASVLNISDKAKVIGESAFQACENIPAANIPYGTTDISASLFAGCTNLSSVTIPNSVITIGNYAFSDCASLEKLIIPESVLSFGDNVFANCSYLTIYGYAGSAAEEYAEENNIQFKVLGDQKDIADADITVMDAKYTGAALKPAVEVTLDGDLLDEGTDYTVVYSNNVNVGKGTVKVTGKGEYTGSAKATFTISPASISGASISGVKDKVYTGKSITQTISVKVGSRKLKSGTDYSVSYANNKNVGTAILTVKGKGNYTGTATASFKILPKGTGISSLAPGKKSFTVQWKKQATQTNGYIIQYGTDSSFKNAKTKKITNVKTTKATISGLLGNKTYYVRICTFKLVNKKTYSSAWSKAKSVKAKN